MAGNYRERLTFSNVVSVISLLFALGLGSAWAATELGKNEVKSKHIKNAGVKGKDLANNAVTSPKVADGSLLGADFAAGQLPQGPPPGASTQQANTAQNADLLDNLDSTDFLRSDGKAVDADRLDGTDASAFARLGSAGWREVGAPGEPSFNDPGGPCAWQNNPLLTDRNTVAFQRDGFGFVHLKGLVRHDGCLFGFGSESNIFQLPAGYQPAKAEVHVAIMHPGALARIDVRPDGWVLPEAPTDQSNAGVWISLDGITFRCAPSGSNGCP